MTVTPQGVKRIPPALLVGILVLGFAWNSADAQTVGGRAYAAFVNAPTLSAGPLYLSDTGELSPNGGWEGAGLPGAEVPGVLSATVLNAATSGAEYDTGPAANSSTSLADVSVLPWHMARLSASFVSATVESTSAGGTGSAEIWNLTFGGQAVTVTGQPNQTIEIPLVGTLIINEQTISAYGAAQTITVNALHLVLATGDEIILGSARSLLNSTGTGVLLARYSAGTSCVGSRSQPAVWRAASAGPLFSPVMWPGEAACIDFVTGGGWYQPPNAQQTQPGRVNFGFNAGPRSAQNPEIKGHLNLVDHSGGPVRHVRGVNVDVYVIWGGDPDHCRVFEGDAVVNGVAGFRYRAIVCDYSEPGRDDRFQLEVFNGGGMSIYFTDNRAFAKPAQRGELDGGNIQLHKSKCTKPADTRPRTAPLDRTTRVAAMVQPPSRHITRRPA